MVDPYSEEHQLSAAEAALPTLEASVSTARQQRVEAAEALRAAAAAEAEAEAAAEAAAAEAAAAVWSLAYAE